MAFNCDIAPWRTGLATSCENCPLRPLSVFAPFTEDELRFMKRFKSGELTVEPGATLLMEGSRSPQLYTALRGMGLRYKSLANGRRQVINFVFPGDFVGLQAGIMGEMRHSVEASSAMTLCVFDRKELWAFYRSSAERAFDITWIAAVEEHFLGEALTTVGQRTAIERVSWALVRLHLRGRALGLADEGGMRLPYKQQDLADALGLSLVHTNKTLAKLRARQLAAWTEGYLRIPDVHALAAIAEMDLDAAEVRPLI